MTSLLLDQESDQKNHKGNCIEKTALFKLQASNGIFWIVRVEKYTDGLFSFCLHLPSQHHEAEEIWENSEDSDE